MTYYTKNNLLTNSQIVSLQPQKKSEVKDITVRNVLSNIIFFLISITSTYIFLSIAAYQAVARLSVIFYMNVILPHKYPHNTDANEVIASHNKILNRSVVYLYQQPSNYAIDIEMLIDEDGRLIVVYDRDTLSKCILPNTRKNILRPSILMDIRRQERIIQKNNNTANKFHIIEIC